MQPLAVKYRPKTLNDVVGQEAIKIILHEQIRTGTFKHGYLFTGPAGCGKTTVARIFADLINDGKGNPYEIDAASNNGVDDIREIRENAARKSLDSPYKVYIIDECHMLSTGAWNAFLKTLEEAPMGTVFVLCTTNPEKIPPTIMSRVQRYDFSKLPFDKIVDQLHKIIDLENAEFVEQIKANDDALNYIAKLAQGGMRDAITMLDKCISYSLDVNIDNVLSTLGQGSFHSMFDLVEAVTTYNITVCMEIIEELYDNGVDLKQYIKNFQYFIIDVCKAKMFNNFDYTNFPDDQYFRAHIHATDFNVMVGLLEMVRQLNSSIKWESSPKEIIQTALLLACVNQTV